MIFKFRPLGGALFLLLPGQEGDVIIAALAADINFYNLVVSHFHPPLIYAGVYYLVCALSTATVESGVWRAAENEMERTD